MAEKHSTQDGVPLCVEYECDKPAICRCYFDLDEGWYCDHHFYSARLRVVKHLEQRFTSTVKTVYGWIAFVTALLADACWWWLFGGYDLFHVRNLIGIETNFIIALILTVVSCYSLLAWFVERYRNNQFHGFGHWNAANAFFSDEEEIRRGEI